MQIVETTVCGNSTNGAPFLFRAPFLPPSFFFFEGPTFYYGLQSTFLCGWPHHSAARFLLMFLRLKKVHLQPQLEWYYGWYGIVMVPPYHNVHCQLRIIFMSPSGEKGQSKQHQKHPKQQHEGRDGEH